MAREGDRAADRPGRLHEPGGEVLAASGLTSQSFPADRTEALTAAGIYCRVLLGEPPARSKKIASGADRCLLQLARWEERGGTIDMIYWYWGTLALREVGDRAWKIWQAAMKSTALNAQQRDGDEKGSWDPLGVWGPDGGRVYSTAVMALVLATEKRYARAEPRR